MLRIRDGLFLGLCALAAGCGNMNSPPITGKSDLGMSSDMGGDLGDMAVIGGPDMVTTLPIPPGCNTQTVVTGTNAYKTLTGTNGMRCMGGRCHNNSIKPMFSTQTTFMAATINQNSTATMPYITPNNPDKSFVMYKLRNLQGTVRNGGGTQMPQGGTPLTDAEACVIYNWILHGAPTN